MLATAAAPCSEPRKQGRTGCFCADPCRDAGADVDRVLTGIENGVLRPDHDAATPHLHAFSLPHFAARLDAMMAPVAAAAKRAFPA